MTKLPVQILWLAALACASTVALAQAPPPVSRGQLLYLTHCNECHTTRMHWRDDRRALDWDGLKAQVRRWQANTGLEWSEADIAEVARYLNDTIYQYPQTSDRLSLAR
jgi:mono/diheme cytochrome c family protein